MTDRPTDTNAYAVVLDVDVAYVLLDALDLLEADRERGGTASAELAAALADRTLFADPRPAHDVLRVAAEACTRVVESPDDLIAHRVLNRFEQRPAWVALRKAVTLLEQAVAAGATPWNEFTTDPEDDPKAHRDGYLDLVRQGRELTGLMLTRSRDRRPDATPGHDTEGGTPHH